MLLWGGDHRIDQVKVLQVIRKNRKEGSVLAALAALEGMGMEDAKKIKEARYVRY